MKITKITNRKFNTGLTIALTATLATVAQPQPASAQLLDVLNVVGGAIGGLVKSKQPQPQVIQQRVPVPVPTPSRPEFSVGTNNANGNKINLCISNCLPAGSASVPAPVPVPMRVPQQVVPSPVPVRVPQQVVPSPVPMRVPQQAAVPSPTSASIVQQQSIAQQQGSVPSGTMANQMVNQSRAMAGTTAVQTAQQSSSAVTSNHPTVNIPNIPNIPNVPQPINLPR